MFDDGQLALWREDPEPLYWLLEELSRSLVDARRRSDWDHVCQVTDWIAPIREDARRAGIQLDMLAANQSADSRI
jgi:hypothetical protein